MCGEKWDHEGRVKLDEINVSRERSTCIQVFCTAITCLSGVFFEAPLLAYTLIRQNFRSCKPIIWVQCEI